MKLSMSRIDSCENSLRISCVEKKHSCRTAISMPKTELKIEEPFKEIFKRDSTPDSIKNNFDRPFRKIYYGPLPPNRSPSSISLMPQRSTKSFWKRFLSYVSTQKRKSYIGLRNMSSAFRKGKSKDRSTESKEPSTPVEDKGVSTKSKSADNKNLGFKTPIEDQEINIHSPKVTASSKPVILKPQTPETSQKTVHKSDEGFVRGSSLNIKKTSVYTHDLLYLTEEDRKQKHEAERKKKEKEKEETSTDPESNRLHPLREGTHSLLDVINPISRSPSSHDLNSSEKSVSKKSSVC